jgi:hypothetical protein
VDLHPLSLMGFADWRLDRLNCGESLKTDPEFSSKTDPPCYCINYSVSVDKLSFFVPESPFLIDFLLVCFLLV